MRRIALIALPLLLLITIGGAATFIRPVSQLRAASQQRWDGRAQTDYRIVVQVEQPDSLCVQDLEVRANVIVHALRDTCRPSWFSALTVARLFELSQRLDLPPECFPSSASCTCRRVRLGQASYDPALGYPQHVEWRRQLSPYWQHIDFWISALEKGALPSCTSALPFTTVRITVMSLTPLT